ncbi:hypothetical protein CXB40_10285 [Pseudomonas syringae pv. avii]|uniref:Uncharacterized protein n=2 Tax=Pseudomonas syringae group genomosp. 3 TaxID=251701 RepID=Q882E9_PSESM|nr:protein of unknown function [Pseudomonas syringae pv. tomato str. DC3000]KPB76335.1 Uncharacterized protein AC505_3990 [Pseudomonas syringae pv. maculicola]KPB99081.1 Uncharacterized protein AC506_2468 [Pseudomonas syringae pv. maculicola str. M6]KPC10821.1 Uncharacterized protein AC500_0133 [Pseudomonas amygdali pv. lachrymans]MCF5225119.1 hypothetical protein [Pseudomonas syringae]POQ08375.1 hypothetical protein CXB40_10285 [Pseudomonas syringae pv. avii]TES56240.1 hypothetical protein E
MGRAIYPLDACVERPAQRGPFLTAQGRVHLTDKAVDNLNG